MASAGKVMRLSVRTVRFHVEGAKKKMGAMTIAQLVAQFIFTHQIGNDLKAEEAA